MITHHASRIMLLLITLALSACVYGDASRAIALGGKGAYKGKTFAMTWDNEASFRDGALLATAAVGAWANVASTKAAEATARAVDANRSAEAINASNNAVKTVDITTKGANAGKAIDAGLNAVPK